MLPPPPPPPPPPHYRIDREWVKEVATTCISIDLDYGCKFALGRD